MKRLLPLFALGILVLSSQGIQSQSALPQRQMTVHYIDVGQGDAILIEFPKAAIMIDAGGEPLGENAGRDRLLRYLSQFFARRTDLKRTIHTIIITHPHLDHTRYLYDVVKSFNVKNLVDGAPSTGNGLNTLLLTKQLIAARRARYITARDYAVQKLDSKSLFNDLRAADPDVGVRILSGSRDCQDQNNDSLVVLVGYKEKRFLFTGDATSQKDEKCPDEISMLIQRYQKSGLLEADVLKVSNHGASNGTTDEWMSLISPEYSIISAGKSDESARSLHPFSAWQVGVPRDSAVQIIQKWTVGFRQQPKPVTTMKDIRVQSEPTLMRKGVYCTCWDGDITVSTDGKNFNVATSR